MPFPSPGDPRTRGIEPMSPVLRVDSLHWAIWEAHYFHRLPFFLEWNPMDTLWLLDMSICRYYFERKKKCQWCQGKPLTLIAANDKILASKQKLEFEYTTFCYQELYSFLILKMFLMRLIMLLINVIFCYCKMKCKIWKIFMTLNQHFLNDQWILL